MAKPKLSRNTTENKTAETERFMETPLSALSLLVKKFTNNLCSFKQISVFLSYIRSIGDGDNKK